MNATLAALYGTGTEKTASEGEEIDLHSISAADFLAALEEVESEKVAEEGELDLSQLSDEDLISLYSQLEESEGEETLSKMASSGELADFTAAHTSSMTAPVPSGECSFAFSHAASIW